MQDRALRIAITSIVLICLSAPRAYATVCQVARGQSIVLASADLDPDVFLWDSGDRLLRYAQGDYDVQTVLRHTQLIRAYTRAMVVSCRNSAVRSPMAGAADPMLYAIGVRVLTGYARGRYGWVLSSDVRRADGSQLTGRSHT